MLQTIVLVLVVLVVIVLLVAATKPGTFRVERTTSITAAPGRIFPLINDFKSWSDWSPWERLDPQLKRNYSGAPSGKGAVYEWAGNKKVGSGRMEILDVSPPSRVRIKLDFLQPFEAHNMAEFTLEPEGGATRVTWATFGPSPFVSKVFQVFVSMDKLIGKDFERGLANLKSQVEG